MEKLAIILLLSVSAPLFATISDAKYEEILRNEKRFVLATTSPGSLQPEVNLITYFPLHYFAYHGNLPAVQYLIEVKHMNPNERNDFGYTPLYYVETAKKITGSHTEGANNYDEISD